MLPNRFHERLFRALGADPVVTDLRDGIAMLRSGELDAQENPLGNFLAYGLNEIHPHLTMTAHVFGVRGIYASAEQIGSWPDGLIAVFAEAAESAIVAQRREAAAWEAKIRADLPGAGVRVIDLSRDELSQFKEVGEKVVAAAAVELDPEVLGLLSG